LDVGGSFIARILSNEIQPEKKAGFRANSSYTEIVDMDAVIISVPPPLNEHHKPDLSYVTGTVQSIASHPHERQLIVLESTTYPGMTEEVMVPLLENHNLSGLRVCRGIHATGFRVASSPEREDLENDAAARHDISKVIGGCGPAEGGPDFRYF
jgi:UDP-N-acetyl-D-glucosamine dehydrogenase